jgi:glycosyltransferase involved in cell wall biosynthesis
VGGIPDVVTDGENGVLVAPGDEPALLQGLAGLLANPARYQQMSASAKLRVGQDFDFRKYQQRLVALYDSLKQAGQPA